MSQQYTLTTCQVLQLGLLSPEFKGSISLPDNLAGQDYKVWSQNKNGSKTGIDVKMNEFPVAGYNLQGTADEVIKKVIGITATIIAASETSQDDSINLTSRIKELKTKYNA